MINLGQLIFYAAALVGALALISILGVIFDRMFIRTRRDEEHIE